LFTIQNKKIVEYIVEQKTTIETVKWIETEFLLKNSTSFITNKRKLSDIDDYFTTKEEAEKILTIIKKYI
jgi:hypothetical protein